MTTTVRELSFRTGVVWGQGVAALGEWCRTLRERIPGPCRVVLASGHFNPIHVGHVRYLRAAAFLGEVVVAVVNNDRQVELKGGRPFMQEAERVELVAAVRGVDIAVLAEDQDRTVRHAIEHVRPDVFANGGDVANEGDVREADVCHRLGVLMAFGVGGTVKVQSSSLLIAEAEKRSGRPPPAGV